MEVQTAIVLAAHPFLAVFVIYSIYTQYGHKKRRRELRGEVAMNAVKVHQKKGVIIYRLAVGVTLIGITVNTLLGVQNNEGILSILPSTPHGVFGLIGIILLTYTVKRGKDIQTAREKKMSSAQVLKQHGRASDILMLLIAIHAFLGFIYLFQILS
ncbi:MAG: hypothetical protein H8D82_00560 [Euryarchaeota archaeon]|nr:hypothetical protein [Euryarchaeota archaeon]